MSSAVKASLASLAVFVLIIVGFLMFDAFEEEGPPPAPPSFDPVSDVPDSGAPGALAGEKQGRDFRILQRASPMGPTLPTISRRWGAERARGSSL